MIRRLITSLPLIIALALSQNIYVKTNDQVRLSPRLINYQGYLTDTLGIPITNPGLAMTFSIYDAQSGGNMKWTENQTVSVSKGIFNVILGNNTPIPDSVFNNTNRWLQLTVAGQILSPRTRIVSTAYAYTATYSDTAQYAKSATADNDWIITGSNMYSGVSGNVGIGRTNPQYKLDVRGIICGGDSNIVISHYGGVLSGKRNQAGENWDTTTVVCGGYNNRALLEYSAICGGSNNYSYGDKSFIGGGRDNYSAQNFTTVAGGAYDSVKTIYGAILGGYSNLAGDETRDTAVVLCTGWNNSALAKYSFAGGGSTNLARAIGSTVGGGVFNQVDSSYGTVTGGYENKTGGYSTIISGGYYNAVGENYGVIGGGVCDTVIAPYGAVLGGYENLVGDYAIDTATTVVGGSNHTISLSRFAFIGGGNNNDAYLDSYGTILGGCFNFASWHGTVVGGKQNGGREYTTIGGGYSHSVASVYGGVLSGYENEILIGDYEDSASVIAGGTENVIEPYATTCSYSAICGGKENYLDDNFATIFGGVDNESYYYSIIMGGVSNGARGISAISGGDHNRTGYHGAIGGGKDNRTYVTGSDDEGLNTIPGGLGDTVCIWRAGFASNYSAYVDTPCFHSAALTTSHTTAENQVRAASFSTGTLDIAMDHPNDPISKILNQYVVASTEILSKYSGSVVLDSDGKAVVYLPDYFEDVNRNPRVQLTGVGTYEVYVAENVNKNRFVIKGKPGTEVYWKVTAERKDIHAEIARIQTPVVQEKKGHLRGHSIDDDAMVGIYDDIKSQNPQLFRFRTDEGRRVCEESKKTVGRRQ